VSPLQPCPSAQLTSLIQIEEQRKYLGGDSDHSILVKGLDFALLEQNKAKAAVASGSVDDESLEQAFLEATSASVVAEAPSNTIPKKRTRQDLINELKEKRGDAGTSAEGGNEKRDIGIEEAKKAGKFRPIGFKPIGNPEKKETRKKEKIRDRQQKKRKINPEEQTKPGQSDHPLPSLPPEKSQQVKEPHTLKKSDPEPEPITADFDIFADAEEYNGFEIDEDDEVGSDGGALSDHKSESESASLPTRPKWFDEPKELTPPPAPEQPLQTKEPIREEVEDEQPMRLIPLASSAVPSIKDMLAMDQAAEKDEKRKARKEKRKQKQELTAEGKASRDYQKYVTLFLF
jgi:IK cytokine